MTDVKNSMTTESTEEHRKNNGINTITVILRGFLGNNTYVPVCQRPVIIMLADYWF